MLKGILCWVDVIVVMLNVIMFMDFIANGNHYYNSQRWRCSKSLPFAGHLCRLSLSTLSVSIPIINLDCNFVPLLIWDCAWWWGRFFFYRATQSTIRWRALKNNDTENSLNFTSTPSGAWILKREKCWKKEKFQKSIIYDIPAEVYNGIELISFFFSCWRR